MQWMYTFWFWLGLALLLFAAEAMLPGALMLWLGFAAAAMGLTVLLAAPEPWVQWSLFGLYAVVAVAIGWRWRRRNPDTHSDQPLLNRRGEQLLGRVLTLQAPISNGRGKAQAGDALWTVEGDDLPQGARVRVVAVEGMVLRVEPAE
ncbi:MAG: NfeD family protein [Lysobacteraceae bacterium]